MVFFNLSNIKGHFTEDADDFKRGAYESRILLRSPLPRAWCAFVSII